MSDTLIDAPVRELDPFAFFAGHRSAIKPLGGQDKGADPRYAFHTPYLQYRPGPVVFRIRFAGLVATIGEMGLHLNAFIPHSGQNATLVNSSRVHLADMASGESEITMQVNAIDGVSYAVFGYILDLTDAHASALSITAQELGSLENETVPEEFHEPTRFGTVDVERPGKLVAEGAPSFHSPISQPMTSAQLAETAYRDRAETLPPQLATPETQWPHAFVLQALDTYDMFHPGTRGLALGDEACILASQLGLMNREIVAARDPSRSGDRPSSEALSAAPVSALALDFTDIPDDLRGFDFIWSVNAANRMGSAMAARSFIESAMRCLRPGGLAVHVFDMAILPAAADGDGSIAIVRSEIERLALTLIARSNDIAQLNFGGMNEPSASHPGRVRVPFGLIIKRGKTKIG